MKLICNLFAAAMILGASSCSEIEDGVNDIDSWPAVYNPQTYTLNHPCLLHSKSDIEYVKSHLGTSPWNEAYGKLTGSDLAQSAYLPQPKEWIARLDNNNWSDGNGRWEQYGVADKWYQGVQNSYTYLMRDAAAAYQLALRYAVGGDNASADAAINILEKWATVNKGMIKGTRGSLKDALIDPNELLILFQVYQVANAAELLRNYNGWGSGNGFKSVVNWLKAYYYPEASSFLKNHNNNPDHYWMNWDLAAMTAILSIGVLDDNQDMINEAILFYKSGNQPGCILLGVPFVHQDPDGTGVMLGQCNESGRDQGHATLCAAMLGIFCQMAYNVGDDLFAFDNHRAVAMAEYIAKYNATKNADGSTYLYQASSLPYTPYSYSDKTMTTISADGRGTVRPGWDLWQGYCKTHGVKTVYSSAFASEMRPDGGAGYYGPNSGGFDQTGFSTLMHYRE